MEIADRVAVLRAGRIEQFDTPGAILARPASAFVAGFLGEANRLGCEVRGGQAHFAPLPLPPVAVALPDGPALAFLRAHDLVARPGEGPWVVRQARQDPRGLRLQVSAGGDGPVLDVTPEPDWREARRGDACTLRLLSAAVFPRGAAKG